MVQYHTVLRQMSAIGVKFRFFGRAEVRELSNILNPGEVIRHCNYGFYQGGSALLVATDHRLLLVDKRPFFLNLEDIRYEMINEVDFAGRLLDASVQLYTGNKRLSFRSMTDARLRKMCEFIQDQITKARQLEHMLEEAKPGSTHWRPYSLLPRPRISKFTSNSQN